MSKEKTIKETFEILKAKYEKLFKQEAKFMEVKTADGLSINIEGELKVGAAATTTDSEGVSIPAPNGEFVLETGETLIVEAGVVSAIMPKVEVEVETEDLKTELEVTKTELASVKADFAAIKELTEGLNTKLDSLIEKSNTEKVEYSKQISDLENINKEMFKVIEVLSNEPAATPINVKKTNSEKLEFARKEKLNSLTTALSKIKNK